MLVAGCSPSPPPGLENAERLDFEVVTTAVYPHTEVDSAKTAQVIRDDAELAARLGRSGVSSIDGAATGAQALGDPPRIPEGQTAVWFYAGDMNNGCYEYSVTGVYVVDAGWVLAVDIYLPRWARDAVCTQALVPAAGVVLVRADPPETVTVVVTQ
jgi:hypothetical protein